MDSYLERIKIVFLIVIERYKRITILTRAMYIPLLLKAMLHFILDTIILFVLIFAPIILLLIGLFILWTIISPNVIVTW